MRIKIIRIIVISLFVMIILDLVAVQVIQGRHFYDLSVNNRIRVVPLEGWRGRIKDRKGNILADNRLAYDVMITPQDIQNGDELFHFLSNALKTPVATLSQRYHRKKAAAFAPVAIAEDIPQEEAIVIEENKYRFPSLLVQENYRRFYPLGKNSAHVLGYLGKISRARREQFKEYGYSLQSVIGYLGVEEYYDTYLRGEEGGLQVEVNSRGQQVRLLGLREPQKGQDITLTIDSDIQRDALDLLEDRPGVVLVMDTDSGEILGMTSTPTFDPNVFVHNEDSDDVSALFTDPQSPILNRAIKGVFPPGSVFKVVMSTAGLDTKKIAVDTTFICNGAFYLNKARFRCTHVHGRQNLIEAIAHSCNVYFYNVGLLLGVETIHRYARLMGLGELTHIDLPYEEAGAMPGQRRVTTGDRQWYSGDTLNISIGQGDTLATPLQMVRMMAAVSRDGVFVRPHVIKAIGDTEVERFSFDRKVRIDKRIFETVQKGLRAAVTDYAGTAHVLDIDDLYVAGKTGTAQTSGGQRNHAWFVGYVKGKNRNIAFCVFLEHGGSSYNACLLARSLLTRMRDQNLL